MTKSDIKLNIQNILDEGKKLSAENKNIEAIKLYKTALIMNKDMDKHYLGSLYIRMANEYYTLENRDKYVYYYEEYLKLFPQGQQSVFSRLAHAYYYISADKCIDYYNKALDLNFSRHDSINKLFAMTKSAYYSQQDIKDESEYEVDQLKNNDFKNIKKYKHDDKKKKPDKKLNIGYLSSDCKAHTMMNYIVPIWENHNKDEFNFFLFNACSKEDSVTKRIEKIGFEMIKCAEMTPEELAKTIYDKKIDILIDLGGYTHLKIHAMLYKPAPVIITYLGYLNTLGIKEVDYILTDRFTIPEDKAYLYTEKPLYLDKGYQIFDEKKLPDIEESPFKTNGYITFGSYNCTSKINDALIFMWSEILKAVPDSKMFIYRTKLTKSIIRHLKTKFKERGISEDRLIFSFKTYSPHYKAYSLSDIALDPYPFNGMSITIETALMGVPTVTLVGEGMQSRGAGRINNVIGLNELNADSGEEYVNIAVDLANDKAKLENLRKTLRDKVNNSDLRLSGAEFTRDLEDKFRKVWADFTNSP